MFLCRHKLKRKNNKIVLQYKQHKYLVALKNIHIHGKNNIVIIKAYSKKELFYFRNLCDKNLKLKIIGNNNKVFLDGTHFTNSYLHIRHDNNRLYIGKPVKSIDGATMYINHGGSIIIGKECELGNDYLLMVVTGDWIEKHKIYIGDGTHIAHGAIIRTSDGECLIDPDTKEPLSKPKDVIIGKNCWIASRCTILKGSYIADGSVVGACSLVNKQFCEPNSLLYGVPAKHQKSNICWTGDSYGCLMDDYVKIKHSQGK